MSQSDDGADAQRVAPVDVMDALHDVFTRHGIASRSDYPIRLILDLVSWATAMCRQSQPAPALSQNDIGFRDLIADGGLPEARRKSLHEAVHQVFHDYSGRPCRTDGGWCDARDHVDAIMELLDARRVAPVEPLDLATLESVASEFEKAEAESRDTQQRIDKRVVGGCGFDGDRQTAAHYGWLVQYYGVRARAVRGALREAQRIPAPPDAPQEL